MVSLDIHIDISFNYHFTDYQSSFVTKHDSVPLRNHLILPSSDSILVDDNQITCT